MTTINRTPEIRSSVLNEIDKKIRKAPWERRLRDSRATFDRDRREARIRGRTAEGEIVRYEIKPIPFSPDIKRARTSRRRLFVDLAKSPLVKREETYVSTEVYTLSRRERRRTRTSAFHGAQGTGGRGGREARE